MFNSFLDSNDSSYITSQSIIINGGKQHRRIKMHYFIQKN